MEKLTYSERLQLAASILPKNQIFERWKNQQQSVGHKLDFEQLYKRHIIEMYRIADLIERYDRDANRFASEVE